MPFTDDDLLLSPDKKAQLTAALSNMSVADPLQYLCDEAAADVARMTTGYVLDDNSTRGFTRALALYRAYSYAGPVPPDVKADYDAAQKELTAIASGQRPNLPKVSTPAQSVIAGSGGSSVLLPGRISGQTGTGN